MNPTSEVWNGAPMDFARSTSSDSSGRVEKKR